MQVIKDEAPKTNKKSKIGKWVLITFLVLLVLGAAALWYWNTNKERIIGNKIEKAVREKSDSLYTFKYDSISLNELGGSFSITNLHVYTDSLDLAKTIARKGTPSLLMEIRIPLINITGLKTSTAFFNNKLIAGKLEITNPVVEILYSGKKTKTEQTIPMDQLHKILLGNLDLIDVDTVLITGGDIRSRRKGSETSFEMEGFNGSFRNVWLDSSAVIDHERLLFSKNFLVSARKFSWFSTEKKYLISLENLSVNSESSEINVDRFSVVPQKTETAFMKSLSARDDRVDFWSTKIQLKGVDIKKLFEDKLIAEQATITQASCKIYRDLTLPKDTKKRVFYIQRKREEGALLFTISRVSISNSLIEYKELNDLTGKTWKMGFNDLDMTINNFTNAGKPNGVTTVDAKARFLNKVPVNLNWTFYLNDPSGRFAVKGESGSLDDGSYLNQVVEPSSMAVIRQGSLQKLSCDLRGSETTVGGKVNLLYKDLKIDVMETDPGASKPDKKLITSLFLNVKTKDENPKGDNSPRVADVSVTRDPTRSIFYACWKTIFTGISDITGIPMPKQ